MYIWEGEHRQEARVASEEGCSVYPARTRPFHEDHMTLSEHFAADEDAQAEARRDELATIGATARAYPRWLAIYCSAYADDAVNERRETA